MHDLGYKKIRRMKIVLGIGLMHAYLDLDRTVILVFPAMSSMVSLVLYHARLSAYIGFSFDRISVLDS